VRSRADLFTVTDQRQVWSGGAECRLGAAGHVKESCTAEAAWEDWVLYVLAGIEQTSRSTLRKITAIKALQDDFSHRARSISKGGADSEFQSILFEQPYCRIATVVERCGVSRPTATAWLTALANGGMLQEVKVGRDRLFINREFLQLLVRSELTDRSAPSSR